VRDLSRLTRILRILMHWWLTISLDSTVCYLRWVLHILSNAQKRTRAHMSGELLQLLQVQEARTWHDVVTLDESWFYLSTDHELIWLPAGASILDRERYMIRFLKLIPTAVWNPHGFHLVDSLSKEMKFNGNCYVTRILELLYE
jgi:hypothetical protein